jgi:AAA family ATP:ADP antiporter
VFAGYGASALLPALAVVAVVKVVENSTDYSLQNTIQQALFLPTSRDAKYKAKQAVDSFFVRMGDVASALLVFIGERLAFSVPIFAAVIVVLTGLWLLVIVRLNALRTREVPIPSARTHAAT